MNLTAPTGGRHYNESIYRVRGSFILTASIQLAFALLLAGLFVLALELFVPSVGMLFFIASICIIASVFVAFQVHWAVGSSFLGVIILLSVVLPGIGLRLWRRSPMGKAMFLDPPPEEREKAPTLSPYAGLEGEVGTTQTAHRLAGITEIQGRRVHTVADGAMIEDNELVKVVAIEGNRVVIRRLSEKERDIFEGRTNPLEFL